MRNDRKGDPDDGAALLHIKQVLPPIRERDCFADGADVENKPEVFDCLRVEAETGQRRMLIYLRGKWPEQPVPDGEPLWLYYEVVEDRDVVTRTVEIFPDGLTLRNSIKLAEREGPDQRHPQHRSLVHGNFLDEAQHWLEVISEAEFNRIWDTAADKPWP